MKRLSALLFALLLLPYTAWAQEAAGTVRGKVTSQSGSPISGAIVTLTNNASHAARTAMSDAQGDFVFAGVGPGTYSVRASRFGLSSQQIDNVTVQPGKVADISFKLAPMQSAAMIYHPNIGMAGALPPPPPVIVPQQPEIAEGATLPPAVAPTAGPDAQPPQNNTMSVVQQQEAEFQSLQTGVLDWILPEVMYPNVPSVVRVQIHGAKSGETLQGANGTAVIKVSDTMYVTLRCISNPAEFTIAPSLEEQAKQQKTIWSTSTQEWSFNVTPNHPSEKETLEVAAFMVYPAVNGQPAQARFIKSWNHDIDVKIPPVPKTIWQSMWDKPALWFGPTGIFVVALGYFTKFFGLFKKKDEKAEK